MVYRKFQIESNRRALNIMSKLFKSSYQKGLLTVFYSGGSAPLSSWGIHVKNGHTRRVTDEDVKTLVLEVCGTNVATAYITCPADPKVTLGIELPFLVLLIKNLKRYFSFEIQVLDDKDMRRRFRFSNYHSATRVRPFACSMPLALGDGWNQIQFNLADFTRRAYGTTYIETQRMQIHANCRVRRVYFSNRIYSDDELPQDYKMYVNMKRPPPASSVQELPADSDKKSTSQTNLQNKS